MPCLSTGSGINKFPFPHSRAFYLRSNSLCPESGYLKKYRIPRIQSTELKKANKLKGPSEDASIPFVREKKAITGRGKEGGRDLNGKGNRKGKRQT